MRKSIENSDIISVTEMTSKAWYKPFSLPQMIARFEQQLQQERSPLTKTSTTQRKRVIEVWTTTCIVTNFGMQRRDGRLPPQTSISSSCYHSHSRPHCSTLINPANPYLTGPSSFPYFPRGGPQPDTSPGKSAHPIMGYVSQWGGMDVGHGMLFPAAVIDGLVHQLGGTRLRYECSLLPAHPYSFAFLNQQSKPITNATDDRGGVTMSRDSATNVKCPVGTAVATSPGGEKLLAEYDVIVHTVPPFYRYPPSMTSELKQLLKIDTDICEKYVSLSEELLRSCYRQSFQLAFTSTRRIEKNVQNTPKIYNKFWKLMGLESEPSSPITPENQRVAVPLLGAGCRAFPTSVALDVAAAESVSWLSTSTMGDNDDLMNNVSIHSTRSLDNGGEMAIVFGLLETLDAEALARRVCDLLTQ